MKLKPEKTFYIASPRLFFLAVFITAATWLNRPDVHVAETQAQSTGGLAKIFTDGTTMTGRGTQADPIRSLVTMSTGIFGDGSDGACVFDGINPVVGNVNPQLGSFYSVPAPYDVYELYIMQRDLYCTTVVISNLVYVDMQGSRMFASSSITLNGNAVLGPLSEVGFAGNSAFPGNGGGASSPNTIRGSGAVGGAGNIGAGSVGPPAGSPGPLGMTGNGGNGGAGAAAGGTGGASGAVFAANQGDLHTIYTCLTSRTPTNTVIATVMSPGGGGGGGDNGTKHGGGGGAGGGYLVAAAPRIVTNNTSTLIASGGDGGAGATGGGPTGGGGGGHGGIACVVIGGGAQPRLTVAGGAGGIGGAGGASGTAGHAGLVLGPGGLAWVVGVQ